MTNEKTTLPISGMTCASCAQTIEGALNKVEGVISASVNLMTEKAVVEYDTEVTDLDKVKQAINGTGYKVEEE